MKLKRTCTFKCPESWSWSLLQLLLPPPWLWPGVLGVFWAALWNILVLKFFLQSRVHKVFWSVQRAGLGHFSNLFSLQGCSTNWPLEYSCSPAPCSSSNSSYNQHLLWKKKTDNKDPCQVQLLFQGSWSYWRMTLPHSSLFLIFCRRLSLHRKVWVRLEGRAGELRRKMSGKFSWSQIHNITIFLLHRSTKVIM